MTVMGTDLNVNKNIALVQGILYQFRVFNRLSQLMCSFMWYIFSHVFNSNVTVEITAITSSQHLVRLLEVTKTSYKTSDFSKFYKTHSHLFCTRSFNLYSKFSSYCISMVLSFSKSQDDQQSSTQREGWGQTLL